MTGRELREWRRRWFPVRERWGEGWSLHVAARWAGVPEKRWLRWEQSGDTRPVPKWLVDRMADPYLSPDERLRPESDRKRTRELKRRQREEDRRAELRGIQRDHAAAIREDRHRSLNPPTPKGR